LPNKSKGNAMNRKTKAVVVEISAPKCATKALGLIKALPGMEYLVGVEGARMEAKKKAQSLERKKLIDEEKERAAATGMAGVDNDELKQGVAMESEDNVEVVVEKQLVATKKMAEPTLVPREEAKAAALPDTNEMPELDEVMALLENRSMSNEERQRKINEMFG